MFSNFYVATEVMTVFVFHEPSQLSALQDNGLPGVVLNSLLMKNVGIIMIGMASSSSLHSVDPGYPRSVGFCSEYPQCPVPQRQRTSHIHRCPTF